ncbi:MAG: M20 family metallopeptidase [Haloarculaceae archaeon]
MVDLRELARELVECPSHADETAAGDLIERWLRAETDATVLRGEFGVLARTGADAPGPGGGVDTRPALALVGHHDVVPPDAAQVRASEGTDDRPDDDGGEGSDADGAIPADAAYVVEERDGRLYGRGSADMKGSLAAALCAFRDAADADAPVAGGHLAVVSFAGEEVGGEGCRAAIDAGFAPERAVVGEGTTGYSAPGVTDVAVAHRGRRAHTLIARGRAAHASRPEEGENAVYRAADAVDAVRDLDAPAATVAGETVEGSLAVTGIEGGTAWNVIPERCEVTVDERTVPGERADVAAAVEAATAGVEPRVDQDLPPMGCGDEAFVGAGLAAARAVQDGAGERIVKPHATDAGWLDRRAGTECLVIGAAEPGEAHTGDESVSLSTLDRCRAIYRRLATAG